MQQPQPHLLYSLTISLVNHFAVAYAEASIWFEIWGSWIGVWELGRRG